MSETSWEKQAKSKTRRWIWLGGMVLFAAAAGIVVYNNRDDFSGGQDSGKGGGESSSFTVNAPADTPEAAREPREEKAAPPAVEKAVKKTVSAPAPAPAAKPVPAVGKKTSGHAAAGTFTPGSGTKVRAAANAAATAGLSADSVEINGVLCSVANRSDIKVRLSMVARCDAADKREVLIKRDALAVVTQKVMRGKDLEEVKVGKIKGELLKAMNALFKNKTISDVVMSSITIEKVSGK